MPILVLTAHVVTISQLVLLSLQTMPLAALSADASAATTADIALGAGVWIVCLWWLFF